MSLVHEVDLRREVGPRQIPGPSFAPPPHLVVQVSQPGHGFSVFTAVRRSGTTWVAADNTIADDIGIVVKVFGTDILWVCLWGIVTIEGGTYTPGDVYYLGPVAGTMVTAVASGKKRPVVYCAGPDLIQVLGPIPVGNQADPTYLISIVSGNTLYPATAQWPLIRGIKYVGSIPTTVPTAIPAVGATYANGLGCGYLLNPDSSNGPLVWVANCPNFANGSAVSAMALPACEDAQATCLVAVTRPVAAGGFATVYLIWAI